MSKQAVPLLKGLREAQSLSQRALAKKSGVAHDTIGQLERGERLANPSTIHKLGAALNVTPNLLTDDLERAVKWVEMVESRSFALVDDFQIDGLLVYLHQIGILDQDRVANIARLANPNYAESMSSASFDDVFNAVQRASHELEKRFGAARPSDARVVPDVKATLLLALSSARLLQLLTEELAADPHNHAHNDPELGRLARSLGDAWLEGAAATKTLLDITDRLSPALGESSLEAESTTKGRREGAKKERGPLGLPVPDITERQLEVLLTVKGRGCVKSSEVAKSLEISATAADRDLSILEKHGLIRPSESGKPVPMWMITPLGRDSAEAIVRRKIEDEGEVIDEGERASDARKDR